MTSVGEVWAYRDKPRTPGTPVHAVEVLQEGPPRTPKRVRIRWVDGEYARLDEWINSSRPGSLTRPSQLVVRL